MSWGAVETWLESLGLGGYSQSFIDNGYDELEVCRQIGSADLDALGVTAGIERARLLTAVNQLQQDTASASNETSSTSCAPVYFTLENTPATTCRDRLSSLISQRLTSDGIALNAQPYTCTQATYTHCYQRLTTIHVGYSTSCDTVRLPPPPPPLPLV